jgi:hypothetical protein
MKHLMSTFLFAGFVILGGQLQAQQQSPSTASAKKSNPSASPAPVKHYFIDVHNLGPGKVTFEAVAQAHAKDLATEGKYGVEFLKFWVDSARGTVVCLSSAYDTAAIVKTHAEAHGLLPDYIYSVKSGTEAEMLGEKNIFLDVHVLGPGKVKAEDVAAAHQKDLAVQKKHGVNFVNYWVNEKDGVIMCLAEAPDSDAVIATHKEAHGLLPNQVYKVKQGQ